MTVKEIAKLAGKSTRTIQRWVEETRRQNVIIRRQNGATKQYETNFILEDTIAIIRAGGNETLANLLLDNAKQSSLTQRDRELIAINEKLNSIMTAIETKPEVKQSLLPAPPKSDRARLNEVVRDYARGLKIKHNIAWGMLYREIHFRMGKNVTVLAKNRNLSTIDYLEQQGLINITLSIALEIFEEGQSETN